MLAYAASRPAPVERRSYPNAMLAIIAVHVAVIAAVMSAKMDLPNVIKRHSTTVFWVPKPETPPPSTPAAQPLPNPEITQTIPTRVDPVVPVRIDQGPTLPPGPPPSLGGGLGTGTAAVIPTIVPPKPYPVKLEPRLLTSGEDLKPPYPSSKLLTEEEATLTLRLSIDERGRVVAVEPVGRTDRVFLDAARRHLLAHWRYRPASEDGRPIASSAVITLRFQLDG